MRRGTAGSACADIASADMSAPGQNVVWLQSVDPIYADFAVTESRLRPDQDGLKVQAGSTPIPAEFKGKVDDDRCRMSESSRMITVRAKIDNPDGRLLPGMYADVPVDRRVPRRKS